MHNIIRFCFIIWRSNIATMDLTLHHLRLLREVAAHGTIAAAADTLGYTSSAVSQQLAGLERACGVAVLERTGRNVRLTDAGRELVRRADALLADAEEALVAVERVGSSVQGVVEAAIYESVAASLLPTLLCELRSQYPELELRTRQIDPDAAIDELVHGTIDLAFAIDYPIAPAPASPDIERWTIMEDRFHLIVAEGDVLSGPTIPLEDLADRRFICSPPEASCGRLLQTACRAAGFEPLVAHAIDDYTASLRLVAAGEGVALVPDLGLVDPPSGIRKIRLSEPLTRSIQLAVRRSSAQRPALVAIREMLERVVAGLSQRPTLVA